MAGKAGEAGPGYVGKVGIWKGMAGVDWTGSEGTGGVRRGSAGVVNFLIRNKTK